MTRFLYYVNESLEFYNGLDLLDSFVPTVFEDRSFEGATTALLRKHFQEWAATAPQVEQGPDYSPFPQSGRYRLCLIMDQEALESVLSISDPEYSFGRGFVRLVNGRWKPEEPDEEEMEALGISDLSELEIYDIVEGCGLWDVGWMKVACEDAETWAFLEIGDNVDWSSYYFRPPLIQTWI